MLALVLAVLATVAGLPPGGRTEPAGGGAASVEATGVGVPGHLRSAGVGLCCGANASDAPAPCGPGDACPPFGGCCGCVACGERVADAPLRTAPVVRRGARLERPPAGQARGIDGGGAVWHPPRG